MTKLKFNLPDTIRNHPVISKCQIVLIYGLMLFLAPMTGKAQTYTIFPINESPDVSLSNDELALECGVKFRVKEAGVITGIRYFKTEGTTGTHKGHIWSSAGVMMAEADFTGETATGWQQVMFDTLIHVDTGITYVASYFSPTGDYTYKNEFFTSRKGDGPVVALADGEDGHNGLYSYSTTPVIPSSSFQESNYWVDVFFVRGNGTDGSAWLLGGNSATNPNYNFAGTNDNKRFLLKSNNKEGLRIDTTGGITIGDTSNAVGKLYVRPAATNKSAVTIRALSGQDTSTYLQDWQKSDGGSLMRIGSNGRVGIGTMAINDTAYRLFVEKGIRTRKIKVDVSSWADYVFDDNYRLPTLADIENYINRNKHLPGMPSAAEATKDGIDLGINQSLLLQKIEELTLHLIDINKKVEQLADENKILKAKISSGEKQQ